MAYYRQALVHGRIPLWKTLGIRFPMLAEIKRVCFIPARVAYGVCHRDGVFVEHPVAHCSPVGSLTSAVAQFCLRAMEQLWRPSSLQQRFFIIHFRISGHIAPDAGCRWRCHGLAGSAAAD